MRILASLIFTLILLPSTFALAESASKSGGPGIGFEGSVGRPTVAITNPDSSIAYYKGIGLIGRGILPTVFFDGFGLSLTGSMKYLDLDNTVNETGQKEVANHIGPGFGARIHIRKLYFGMDYYYMMARHYAVGAYSHEINYSYTSPTVYGGLGIPIGIMDLGVTYSMSSGSVPSAKTGLSKDSAYKETMIMFTITIDTGAGLGKMFDLLTK